MASPPDDPPKIEYVVEIAPAESLRLKVRIRDREIPLTMSPEQAGLVGRALLAASVISRAGELPPEGTVIESCHFPVLRWGTGSSTNNGLPVLLVELPGGTQLTLQFDQQTALQCGAGLVRAGAEPPQAS